MQTMHRIFGFSIAALALWCGCLSTGAIAQTVVPPKATSTVVPSLIDIDGNGIVDAEHDGLLMLRYMSGMRGESLIAGAIGQNASRTLATQVEDYIASLIGAPPSDCAIVAVPASSAASPLAAGTPVQLAANCLSGVKPIAFDWGSAGIAPSISVSPAQTTTYAASPGNSAGIGSQFNATVYIAGSSNDVADDTTATPNAN